MPARATEDDPELGPRPGPLQFKLILVLAFVNLTSLADRIVLNLLAPALQTSFGLSDTRISLLQGPAFAVSFLLSTLAVGPLIDRVERRRIVAAGALVFGLSTAAGGLARGFTDLMVSRLGVAAGEATLQPAAYAMLADAHPPSKVGRALGLYTFGATLGLAGAYFLGGAVARWGASVSEAGGGWRWALAAAGALGICGALAAMTLRQPARPREARSAQRSSAWRHCVAHSSFYVPLFAGLSVVILWGYATTSWQPSLLIRLFHLKVAEAGAALGVIALCSFGPGAYVAGWLSDRLTRRGWRSAPVAVAALGVALAWPAGAAAPLVGSVPLALTLYALRDFFFVFPIALAGAAVQAPTPSDIRGRVAVIYGLAVNIVGLGLGPPLTALLTDRLFHGGEGLRYSLAAVGLVLPPVAFGLLLLAARRFGDAAPDRDRT